MILEVEMKPPSFLRVNDWKVADQFHKSSEKRNFHLLNKKRLLHLNWIPLIKIVLKMQDIHCMCYHFNASTLAMCVTTAHIN